MNKERFISLVKNPMLLKADDGPFLEELIKEFPFFQTAHLLAARCYKVTDSIRLQKQIKIAATHITDRKVLYNLIENMDLATQTTKTTVSKEIEAAQTPNTDLKDKTVVDEIKLTPEIKVVDEIAPVIVNAEKELQSEPLLDETDVKSQMNAQPDDLQIASVEPESKYDLDDVLEIEEPKQEEIHQETQLPSEETTSTKEFEIPLENEIKLAAAEFIFLKEFEQVAPEKHEIPSKDEEKQIEPAQDLQKSDEISETAENSPVQLGENETPTDFVSWLKKLESVQSNDEKAPAKSIEITRNKESDKLMEAFMEKPIQRAKPVKKEFFSPVNMAKQSVTDNDFFVTETLAKIYVKQGNLTKAIKVYQNLSLKNPEKNTFFAAQIKILKEQLYNKSGK